MEDNQQFTHINEQGRARMVDVSEKQETSRTAVAHTTLTMRPSTLDKIKRGQVSKGDVLGVAQVAGVMAAKQTSNWIPMCHPIAISGVDIRFSDNDSDELYIEATVKTTGKTGVEMEALTAASCAALTVYDMCKALEKGIVIGPTFLLSKSGGKSGDYRRDLI
ncbi:cyclic pyranopterin monophosphate synthase MoaC [Ferviditalea candida]|uniref:Cyclic pyranopterin monophosphate synthase n=1 Tax=Ferviditalea candida TaxID=3108399 RepID=A0ABU5ZHZ1_9BACL|nr:cyclic pyranopterin monophosphate synthase MoaC [Paenibacillaceae bacterium T2]